MMDEEDYTINTNCVVGAIINKRIEKEGFHWQTSPTGSCSNNKVVKISWRLCEEFEKRYDKQFEEMCSACNGHGVDYGFYITVLKQLVKDDLHWGRITAILTFAGVVSAYCMKTGHSEKVDFVREWTSSFIQQNCERWMNDNNGWVGILQI